MLIANYHTHTPRCNHASGTEEEYVQAAIDAGLKILGFSDHTPYFAMPREHYSGFRMKPELADDYFASVQAVKEKYKDKITIYTGVEAEFYPLFFEDLLEKFKNYPIDYMILGQHYPENEIGAQYSCVPTSDENYLKRFVNQLCTAIDTDAFTYIAHPDIVKFTGDDTAYAKIMEKLCVHALEKDIPLEINLLGLGDKRHYPSDRFFRLAGELGNKVIIGCDAHNPQMLNPGHVYDEAIEMVNKYKLNLIDTVTLKDPKKAHFKLQ